LNQDKNVFGFRTYGNKNGFRFRMSRAVGKSLLNHTIDTRLLSVSELIARTIHLNCRGNTCVSRKLSALPLKRCLKAEIIKHRWPQAHREISNGAHGVGIQAFGVLQPRVEGVIFAMP
jgi:hypothetical protein